MIPYGSGSKGQNLCIAALVLAGKSGSPSVISPATHGSAGGREVLLTVGQGFGGAQRLCILVTTCVELKKTDFTPRLMSQ